MGYKKIGKRLYAGPPATEKFDMEIPYHRQLRIVRPILWLISFLGKWVHRGKIRKVGMEGVKSPYVLLCNHNSPYDYLIMTAAIAPHAGIYPAAPNVFLGGESLLRNLGCIPKRKYVKDISLIRTAHKVVQAGDMMCIFVEARHSLCGKTEVIADSIGQMVKRLGVPVVTLRMSGHHITNPFWNVASYRMGFPVEATMTQIYTPEQLKEASADEINAKIKEYLYNDDFRYQSENRLKLKYKKRAEGLHNALYHCPNCGAQHQMDSKGAKVFCNACGKSWTLNYYGELEADSGETEFKFPTDWYDWEREQVKKEVEDGSYYFESEVVVNDLPNAKGFVRLGKGKFVHDMDGYKLQGVRDYDGEPFEMIIPAAGQFACHVEFKYKYGGYRDCIVLNTIDDTWYVYPDSKEFSGTKISLATEEIFNKITREKKLRVRA